MGKIAVFRCALSETIQVKLGDTENYDCHCGMMHILQNIDVCYLFIGIFAHTMVSSIVSIVYVKNIHTNGFKTFSWKVQYKLYKTGMRKNTIFESVYIYMEVQMYTNDQ